MELQKIRRLIELMAQSGLAQMELVEGDHRVRLVRRVKDDADGGFAHEDGRAASYAGAPAPSAAAQVSARGSQVASPMHGVLHLSPAPAEPPFAPLGSRVLPGQTLCLIEAMKTFHEVLAEHDGQVVEIFAATGEEVAAGQALFQLAPAR